MADTLDGPGTRALKPDFLMLKGWPATVPPPTGVTRDQGGVAVRDLLLADLTFTMDDGPERWAEKRKYERLLANMRKPG
jgi:hypothetical protein